MTASKKSAPTTEATERKIDQTGAAYCIPLTDLNPNEPVYGLELASGKITALRSKAKAELSARRTYQATDRLESERARRDEAAGRRMERELSEPAV